MSASSSLISAIAIIVALLAIVCAIYGTARAARPRTPAQGLAWMSMVAAAYVLLALGAALRAPHGDGLRAMAFQAGVVLLAAALGWLSLKPGGAGPGKGLASVALFIAWLSLLGLPPTAGFHARVLIYRSLLQAGWSGTLVFALAVGAAALVPAFGALALGCPGSVRGGRGFLVILLICALVASGLYPELGLSVASSLAGSR